MNSGADEMQRSLHILTSQHEFLKTGELAQ